jgi:predicted ester cyclase
MTPSETVGVREPVALIREVFAHALNRRDADALLQYWAEDVVEQMPVGTYRGQKEVRDYFAGVFAALPDFQIDARAIVGEGETVMVRWHISGTFTGEKWMGIEPTGSNIDLDGFDCFTVKSGRIASNFMVFDQLSFARQIGMLPEQGTPMERAMIAAFNAKTRLRKRLRRG